MSSIYDQVIESGLAFDHRESDLYIRVCPKAWAMISCYVHKANVTTFICQLDGQEWFDVPFAYDPYWNDAEKKVEQWAAKVARG